MEKAERLLNARAKKQQELMELEVELHRQRLIEAKTRNLEQADPEAASILREAIERADRAEQRATDLERQAAELAEGQGGTEELEGLRQQLERERARRQLAEEAFVGEAKQLKAMRRQLKEEQDRRKAAEAEAADLRFEIEGIYATQEAAEQEAAAEAYQRWIDNPSSCQPAVTATGLTFPYTTKELEAMRAAVAKYWEGYTPDKRQPTQVEVQLELCELLGLERMKNGDPPRKVKALAGAIKPDTLPDA